MRLTPLLSGADCAFTQVKVPAKALSQVTRNVVKYFVLPTKCSTLVYDHHIIQLQYSTVLGKYDKSRVAVLSEWPFQNPEIASRPDADQKITFYPPE